MTDENKETPLSERISSQLHRANELREKIQNRTARLLVKTFARMVTEPETGIGYLSESIPFSPEHIVLSYGRGLFPTIDKLGVTKWHSPEKRGIIPLDENFHVPKNIRKLVNKDQFEIIFDRDFEATIHNCADREETWITDMLTQSFIKLHEMGIAHSVEAWMDGKLVGGLYGLAIGGFFAGESKFFRVSGASDVAFVRVHEHLIERGFTIHDCQRVTPHLARFGAKDVTRAEFQNMMIKAITSPVTFYPQTDDETEAEA